MGQRQEEKLHLTGKLLTILMVISPNAMEACTARFKKMNPISIPVSSKLGPSF